MTITVYICARHKPLAGYFCRFLWDAVETKGPLQRQVSLAPIALKSPHVVTQEIQSDARHTFLRVYEQ